MPVTGGLRDAVAGDSAAFSRAADQYRTLSDAAVAASIGFEDVAAAALEIIGDRAKRQPQLTTARWLMQIVALTAPERVALGDSSVLPAPVRRILEECSTDALCVWISTFGVAREQENDHGN